MKYSKNGKRFLAYFLDNVIMLIPTAILAYVAMGKPAWTQLLNMASVLTYFLYSFLLEIGKAHATLGKRAAKIRVASADGSAPNALDVAVRNAVKYLPMLLSTVFDNPVLLYGASMLQLIYCIVPFCNTKHRTIHDMIAGTCAIEEGTQMEATEPLGGFVPDATDTAQEPLTEPEKEHTQAPAFDRTMPPVFATKTFRLRCVSGCFAGAEFPLDQAIIMGRAASGCTLHFPDNTPGISRVHCSISIQNGVVMLKDMNSSYGILVNQNRKMTAGEEIVLKMGESFTIGKDETFVVCE